MTNKTVCRVCQLLPACCLNRMPLNSFSILLPGALLTDLLMGEVGPAMLRDSYDPLAGAEA